MVPRGRIGLPTQRFSVSCSTTELPWHMVGVDGLEPSTSPLSEVRSNQLSYTPICKKSYARILILIPIWKSSPFLKKLLFWILSWIFIFFSYTRNLIFTKGNNNGYNLLYTMNNFMYNSNSLIYFTMTSLTTNMIHCYNISSNFYESTIFSTIYYYSMNSNNSFNDFWLLPSNIMN